MVTHAEKSTNAYNNSNWILVKPTISHLVPKAYYRNPIFGGRLFYVEDRPVFQAALIAEEGICVLR